MSVMFISGCSECNISDIEAEVYDLNFKDAYPERVVEEKVVRNWDGEIVTDFFGNPKTTTETYTVHHPAEYWIFFKYDGMTAKTNNEELYRSTEVGKKVKASLFEHYNKKTGKLENRYITKWCPPTVDENRTKLKKIEGQ